MNTLTMYQLSLLILVVYREARGEPFEAKLAVASVIKNRVNSSKVARWGFGWDGVILHPYQFSSFNPPHTDADGKIHYDPNAFLVPGVNAPGMAECIKVAELVFYGSATDNTQGATYYYDKSLDSNQPAWAKDGSMVRTCSIGSFHFYRGA